MSPIARPESVGSRRGRRIAILLVVLLLIGLPLYLWPLHGGIEGLPGATALSGAPPDPRSAKAVAQLPADVWAELMGHGRPPAPSSGGPKVHDNLTRITPHEEGDGNGSLGSGGGPAVFPRLDAGSTPPLIALLADGGAGSGGDSSGGASSDSTSSSSGASPSGGGAGGQGGSGWSSPFLGGVGPFSGGGGPGGDDGSAPPTFIADPGPDDPPMPTPEPGTLLLVGSNLALIGAIAWRCLRRREEREPSG